MENGTKPKPFVFTIMPFDVSFDDIYILGIRQACEDAGAYCERVDEQIFQETILQRIYNQIAKADVIIADMTGRNPNVFYEAGYAHALGKRVILLTQNIDDIPFDLKYYPHIVYSGKIVNLKKIERRIRWAISNPTQVNQPDFDKPQFYMAGKQLQNGSSMAIKIPDRVWSQPPRIRFAIDIHNPHG